MTILKKVLLVMFVMFSATAFAAGDEDEKWENVIKAIMQVESGGNMNARNGSYVGPLQISPILVRECNNILKSRQSEKRFTLNDRTNFEKSKEMFLLIQDRYNPSGDIEKAIRSWNGGIHYSVKSTNRYYNKVMSLVRQYED